MKTIFERYNLTSILMVTALISIITLFGSVMLAAFGAPRWTGLVMISIAILNIFFVMYIGIFKLGKKR